LRHAGEKPSRDTGDLENNVRIKCLFGISMLRLISIVNCASMLFQAVQLRELLVGSGEYEYEKVARGIGRRRHARLRGLRQSEENRYDGDR
jgi:hypothetical protein